MLRDVFYYGAKPNVHPREKFAENLTDARNQCTTEHFWIINEFCDYRNFDWDFDFDFLPDEDVWAEDHINVWPSQHQKDSGTWLCSENHSDIIVYRTDVDPVPRKNEKNDHWVELDLIDTSKVDFSWHPDPSEPPYIYRWGTRHYPVEMYPVLEYRVPDATEIKYMGIVIELTSSNSVTQKTIGTLELLPQWDRWKILTEVDKTKFDFTWRPDPREPPLIYVWGNEYEMAEIKPTLEYHCPEATKRKYMREKVPVLPQLDRWKEIQSIDKSKFDLAWRPDPGSPPYIHVWGNKHVPAELQSTIEYHVPDATERKYMGNDVEVLPEFDKWKEIQPVDKSKFDFSWRPDPREPAYICTWGNKYIDASLKPTLEYHCAGATERKYMGNDVEVLPESDKWNIIIPVDKSSFDFSWRPDPREPAYIYVWGNQSNDAKKEPTVEYHCVGATERKYMTDVVAKTLPVVENWKTLIPVEDFDYSWRPDPHSTPYIYVFGNQWHDAATEPTVEYHVEGAIDKKFIADIVPKAAKTQENWKTLIPVEVFDYSWRPNPHSTPYIYVFGNQWHDAVTEPTVEYHAPGATDRKYVSDISATVKSTSTEEYWKRLIPVESFDYSWRPDPNSPPYIYVFGNKWNDASTEPSVEYHCDGATEYKYMNEPVATPNSIIQNWSISNNDDLETFDFSWRPNPHSPPQIYQWADNGPRYTMPGATEVVFMEHTNQTKKVTVNRYKINTTLDDLVNQHPDEVFWAINPDLTYDKFDFSWRPDENNFRHINVFGNEYSKDTHTYYVNGPLYKMGYREYNYVEGKTVEIDSNLSMFFIDRSNTESNERYEQLKERYPQLQKTRYLNSWVETINRCIAKSNTRLFWVLNSELDYSQFDFDFYPSPWQEKMVHVFGTQWSHWGTTFLVNKEQFPEDTKYVKVIEHLNMLNFVKNKRVIASDCLYPIYVIDHGNELVDNIKGIPVTTIKYEYSYLLTLRNLLKTLPEKKDHYIWVCSSICDYENFDFSYICDPYTKDQLHVFPSDGQQSGDTFLIDVNKLRSLVSEMVMLEDYEKINYNQHQKVSRLSPPVIVTEGDTHVSSIQTDFDWPYAIFVTEDNKDLSIKDHEPISLWTAETKNILITSAGASRIIVPREAKEYVYSELYDYPYIGRAKTLVNSNPMDIVYLSNGEEGAEENWEHLQKITKGLKNRVVRVDGVNGRVQAYHAALEASETPWAFTVFAKLKVNPKFDWNWQPDRMQVPKHYIFYAENPVNSLIYGHQAMIAYNKKLALANKGKGLDFTLDDEHEVVQALSGVAHYNTDPFSTWRTAFREVLKLKAEGSYIAQSRLTAWLNKAQGNFAEYSLKGAADADMYYDEVNGDFDKLKLSYEWAWLRERFTQNT